MFLIVASGPAACVSDVAQTAAAALARIADLRRQGLTVRIFDPRGRERSVREIALLASSGRHDIVG